MFSLIKTFSDVLSLKFISNDMFIPLMLGIKNSYMQLSFLFSVIRLLLSAVVEYFPVVRSILANF